MSLKTRSKKIKEEIEIETARFCDRARIGFSAGGGTINVLAGEASRFFGINFTAAVRAVNKAAVRAEGFLWGPSLKKAGGMLLVLGDIFLAGRYLNAESGGHPLKLVARNDDQFFYAPEHRDPQSIAFFCRE